MGTRTLRKKTRGEYKKGRKLWPMDVILVLQSALPKNKGGIKVIVKLFGTQLLINGTVAHLNDVTKKKILLSRVNMSNRTKTIKVEDIDKLALASDIIG